MELTTKEIPLGQMVEVVEKATKDVFSVMFSIEVEAGQAFVEAVTEGTVHGVISLVGLAGAWAGTGSLYLSPSCACRLASGLLGTNYSMIDDDVLDSIGELTSIVFGNVKGRLEPVLGHMGIAIPTVIWGRNLTSHAVNHGGECTVVPFSFDGEEFSVKFCLQPSEPPRATTVRQQGKLIRA